MPIVLVRPAHFHRHNTPSSPPAGRTRRSGRRRGPGGGRDAGWAGAAHQQLRGAAGHPRAHGAELAHQRPARAGRQGAHAAAAQVDPHHGRRRARHDRHAAARRFAPPCLGALSTAHVGVPQPGSRGGAGRGWRARGGSGRRGGGVLRKGRPVGWVGRSLLSFGSGGIAGMGASRGTPPCSRKQGWIDRAPRISPPAEGSG